MVSVVLAHEQMSAGAFSDKDFSEGHAQPRALTVAPLPVALNKLKTWVFGQWTVSGRVGLLCPSKNRSESPRGHLQQPSGSIPSECYIYGSKNRDNYLLHI